MSYCVEYNPEFHKQYPLVLKKNRLPIKIIGAMLLLSVAIYGIKSGGVVEHLIPGDDEVTVTAFSDMVKTVRQGGSIGESIQTFCREIITSGME